MTNELIPINNNGKGNKTVSAKQLYEFLGLDKSNWAKWYKVNIVNNKFAIENEDYIPLVQGTNANGTLNMDFEITIEFGKKLSMMTKTEKGEEARNWFLQCEVQLQQQVFQFPQTYLEALKAYTNEIEEKEQEKEKRLLAEQAFEQVKPKVDAFDVFLGAENGIPVGDVAKVLNIGQNKLFKILKEDGIFMQNNLPYQKYMDRPNYFRVHEVTKTIHGQKVNIPQTLVCSRGQAFIAQHLKRREQSKQA